MYPFNSTLKGKYQNPQKKLICFSAFGIQKKPERNRYKQYIHNVCVLMHN